MLQAGRPFGSRSRRPDPPRRSPGPALLALVLAALSAPVHGDVVLEQVEGMAALEPGDVAGAWRKLDREGDVAAQGRLEDPFDLLALLRDQVPRGGVEVRRGGEWLSVPLHGAKLRAEPRLAEPRLTAFRRAAELSGSEDAADREAGLSRLQELAATVDRPEDRAWLLFRLAQAHEDAGALEEAAAALTDAAETPGIPALTESMLRQSLALALRGLRRLQEAAAEARAALERLAAAGNEAPVLAAWIESDLGLYTLFEDDHDEAERRLTSAARSLGLHAPGSDQEGVAWHRAGIVASLQGDFALAARRGERALAIYEELGASTASTVNNLAIVARQRGDLQRAEELYLRALGLTDAPGLRALTRGNLANLYRQRGELERARDLLAELATFYREERPEAVFALSSVLTNLGEVERAAGNLDAAERHVREALALKEGRAPESLGTANTLNALGRILRLQERWPEAREVHGRALEIAEEASPSGPLAAEGHAELGAVALGEGDLDAAEERYRQALEMQRAIALGTVYEARWLHALGRIAELRGAPEAALDGYLEAVEILEALRGRLGGAEEAGAGFTSLHHELYWRPLDLLAAAGRAAEAFHLLERYRAQALLAMLARRDLDLSAELPPELDRERRRLAARHDSTLQRLLRATGDVDAEGRRSLREELDRIRREQRETEDRIHAASPRLGRLRNPSPLGVAAAGDLLPPDSLLLSYAVGPERSWAFVVGPGTRGADVVELPAGLTELHRQVTTFRELVGRPLGRPGALRATGETLTRTLLLPIAERLGTARHLVILPDGPLHLLPWAALPDPADRPEPLIGRRAVSIGVSATVLAELRERRTDAPRALVAFGDPTPQPAEESPEALAAALRSADDLGPLPGSRAEVAALAELFGEDAEIFVGDEVTEERLLAVAPTGHRLHLACHAVVDPRQPLDSGLVLAPSDGADEGANGFLQVWEIYQRLRLEGDLVTLSACETALGRELAGEGVLGLTRAFHYAGARTVVSSLWKVSDEASARLMERFYRHLIDGAGKAEALRRAQLELLRGAPDAARAGTSHPFYWAAFQVHGAWD